MMAFNVALASIAVELSEVEIAYLTCERSAARQYAAYLSLPQGSISLTLHVKAQQVPAFQYTALIVRGIALLRSQKR